MIRCGLVCIAVSGALLTYPAALFAAPTALTVIPTADVLAPDTIRLEVASNGEDVFLGGDCDRSLYVQVGLGCDIEAGVDFCLDGGGPWLNAKWQALPEQRNWPALALGIQAVGQGEQAQPYLALARSIGSVRGHLGAIRLNSRTELMAGATTPLGTRAALYADYISGTAHTASLAVSAILGHGGYLTVGRIFANDSGGDDRWYMSVGYEAYIGDH